MDKLCTSIDRNHHYFSGHNARVTAFALLMYYGVVPRKKEEKSKIPVFRSIENKLLKAGVLTKALIASATSKPLSTNHLRKTLMTPTHVVEGVIPGYQGDIPLTHRQHRAYEPEDVEMIESSHDDDDDEGDDDVDYDEDEEEKGEGETRPAKKSSLPQEGGIKARMRAATAQREKDVVRIRKLKKRCKQLTEDIIQHEENSVA